MPKPDLIKDRDKRTAKRKMDKAKFDAMFDLSVDNPYRIRLLDEGMVTYADGSPYFYIKKGVIANLVDKLSDNYVGSINLGHMDFATFPFILGTWKKKDLVLVDIGDGRMALDVTPHFDHDSMFIKELKRLPYDIAVSAEFSAHTDWGLSQNFGIQVVDEIYPDDFNFAIVGEPGNVNSAGVRLALKGEEMTLTELSAAIEENKPDLTSIASLLAEDVHEESPVELAVEENAQTSEEVEDTELAVDEKSDEAVEESAHEMALEAQESVGEEESEGEGTDVALEVEEAHDGLAEVLEKMSALTARLDALEAENASLKEKLSAKAKEEEDFVNKFKNLTISLTKERPKQKPVPSKAYTDGFGE